MFYNLYLIIVAAPRLDFMYFTTHTMSKSTSLFVRFAYLGMMSLLQHCYIINIQYFNRYSEQYVQTGNKVINTILVERTFTKVTLTLFLPLPNSTNDLQLLVESGL